MYNHNKAQQSKNRVHISWGILYVGNIVIRLFVFNSHEQLYTFQWYPTSSASPFSLSGYFVNSNLPNIALAAKQ